MIEPYLSCAIYEFSSLWVGGQKQPGGIELAIILACKRSTHWIYPQRNSDTDPWVSRNRR